MVNRILVQVALVVSFVFASIGSTRAESPADSAKAREAFEKATAYFNAHEFEAALPYYKTAYELSGHRPSTVRALAQCERALKDYDSAILHFQEYLASRPEEAKQIVGTLQMLEELRTRQRETERAERLATTAPAPKAAEVPAAKARETPVDLQASTPPPQPDIALVQPAPEPEDSNTTTVVLLVVGGLAVIGGAVALGLVLSNDKEPYGGTQDVVFR